MVSLWKLFWKTTACLHKPFPAPFFLFLSPLMEAENSNTASLPQTRCGHVIWLGPMKRRESLLGASGKFYFFIYESSLMLSIPPFPISNAEVMSRAGVAIVGPWCYKHVKEKPVYHKWKNRKIKRSRRHSWAARQWDHFQKMLHHLNFCCWVLWYLQLNTFLNGIICQCLAGGWWGGTRRWEYRS